LTRPARNRLLANLLLLAVSLGVPLLIGEIALRVRLGPPIHWIFPQETYQADPESGYRLVPGQASHTHDQPVFVNSLGLRAAEVPRSVPEGTERILALGDSQTFGVGLPLADTWPAQLELALDQRGGAPRREVLNAGLPASDTCQQVAILRRLLRELEFDAVVLGFYVNDVTCVVPGAPVPLGSSDAPARRILYALKRSAVFTALWQARVTLSNWLRPAQGFAVENHVLDGTPDPFVDAGWARVTAFLTEMKASLAARAIPFTILVIPRRDQVRDARAPTAYNRRIAAIAAGLGIPTVDALHALRSAWATHGDALFIPWDGHDSKLANQVMARLLAASLAPEPR
jgi:lysophospholipase L1-like esterase